MPLITTIEEVRAAGVMVNFINEDSNIADMTAAELMFIKPALGAELYTEIVATPADFEDLLPYIKRALAPLAYWLDLPNIQTQITDKGIATAESQNMTAAHKWEYEALRDNLEIKGCFGLESLLEFLSVPEITAAYEWVIPEEYNLIFKTGINFNEYFTLYQPYRSFFSMRPCLKQIEDHYIRDSIGDDFFEEMRDLVLPADKSSWTDDQKKQNNALQLIKKAAAYLTIAKSVDLLPVKISGNGFTVSLRDAIDKPNPQDQHAPDAQLYNLRNSAQAAGERYLLQLLAYLNANAADSLFSTFKNSSYYTAPSTEVAVDKNSCRKIFTL